MPHGLGTAYIFIYFLNRNKICKLKRSESANGDTGEHLPGAPATRSLDAVLRWVHCFPCSVSSGDRFCVHKASGGHTCPWVFCINHSLLHSGPAPCCLSPVFPGRSVRAELFPLIVWLSCVCLFLSLPLWDLQDLSSRPGIESMSLAVEAWSPNHWTPGNSCVRVCV